MESVGFDVGKFSRELFDTTSTILWKRGSTTGETACKSSYGKILSEITIDARSWYAVLAFACQKMPKADYSQSSWPCRSTNIKMMYRSFRTDLPPLLLTTPAKYSFHGSTSVAPRRSRSSVKMIFAVVLEVIVTCDSVAPPVWYLGRVEHCAIQVYGTARGNEDRRRF